MNIHLASTLSVQLLDGAPEPALVTGAALFDVTALDAQPISGSGPAWIKLSPRGRFVTRDGRSFEVDPEALAARFSADAIDVPLDVDHATVRKAVFGETAPAIGWIKELAAKPDGLHARVEWLDAGLTILAARSHRYVSPAFRADETGKVSWIHSAGLVAAPALSMPAVASADTTHQQEPVMLKKIAQALGLADSADETACLSAIANLSQRVDKAVHDQVLETLATTNNELSTIKAEARKKVVSDLIEGGLSAKKILPAQKTHFEGLCSTDEGLASVTALLAATAPGLGASGLDDTPLPGQISALSAEDKEVMKMLGLTEEEYRKANPDLAAA